MPKGSTAAPTLRHAHTTPSAPPTRALPGWRHRAPLVLILLAQAGVTAWLATRNTVFLDEGTYIVAGHTQLAHWLHGAPCPTYARFLSGSPALYPVVAALADSLAGLAGARLFSVACMLAATLLVYAAGRRLFDHRAALLGAALFAGCGPTLFLGALATYDAPAVCLLALGFYLAVRLGERPSAWLLCGTALAGVTAAAVKYAAALFLPVVVLVAVTVDWPRRGPRRALLLGAGLAGVMAAVLSLLAGVAGPDTWHGIAYTTTARAHGTLGAGTVLHTAFWWIGFLAVTGIIGVALRAVTLEGVRAAGTATTVVLAAAAWLAPLQEARLGTTQSLYKHIAYGAVFAAPIAGFAAAWGSRNPWMRKLAQVTTAAVVAVSWVVGLVMADTQYRAWPNSTALTAALRPLVATHPGPYLAEEDYVEEYQLEDVTTWQTWQDTYALTYTPPGGRPLNGRPAYLAAVRARRWSVIVLDWGATPGLSTAIRREAMADGYTLAAAPPADTATHHGHYLILVRPEGAAA